MNIKYLFDQEINEKDKSALKLLTSKISSSSNIGIYFTKKTKYLSLTVYEQEILSNCKSVFYIHTNVILEVLDLSDIMSFLINQEYDRASNFEYYMFAKKKNSDVIKLTILKYVYFEFSITKFNQRNVNSTNSNFMKDTCEYKEKIIKVSSSYYIDIVNGRLITFNVQIKSGNYCDKIKESSTTINYCNYNYYHYNNQEYKADFDKMKIFESDKEHHDLIDLYNDYCDNRNQSNQSNHRSCNTKINSNQEINASVSKLLNQSFDKKTVIVLVKGTKIILNFSINDDFIQIFEWIKKKFGEGQVRFDIDLENDKEVIKYEISN